MANFYPSKGVFFILLQCSSKHSSTVGKKKKKERDLVIYGHLFYLMWEIRYRIIFFLANCKMFMVPSYRRFCYSASFTWFTLQ